jgi:hypothetical protein
MRLVSAGSGFLPCGIGPWVVGRGVRVRLPATNQATAASSFVGK